MAYVAYTLIALGLILHAYDNITDKKREIKNMVLLRQYITLLFFLGAAAFGFAESFTGYGFILLAFILMTALSSWMFGMNVAVYMEDKEQGISRGLNSRKNKEREEWD